MNDISVLVMTSFSIAAVHTLLGPDHYLPFLVISKARGWTMRKTLLITIISGFAHVISSVALGFAGIALGTALFKLEAFESFRGQLAGWFLLIFGFVYMVWAIFQMIRNREHSHAHEDGEGGVHDHAHTHQHKHLHVHDDKQLSAWILFMIFLFGPCEPLIPLLMYPAAQHNMPAVLLVATIFGVTTIGMMVVMVLGLSYGMDKMRFSFFEKYGNVIAGAVIFLSGIGINFLGL